MNKKFKYLFILLLTCFLTSCNKDYIFVGDNKLGNMTHKTVMGVELPKAPFEINDVSLKLYLGFSEVSFDYDMTYCIYIENQTDDYEEIVSVLDYTKLKNHNYITSYTDNEAVEKFGFAIIKNRVNYTNYIDIKLDRELFRYKSGYINIKAIGFVKTTDNNYKVNNLQANQMVSFKYRTDFKKVYFGATYDTLPTF